MTGDIDRYLGSHQKPLITVKKQVSLWFMTTHSSIMPSILLKVKLLSEGTAKKMKLTVDHPGIAFCYSKQKVVLNSVLRFNDFLSVLFHDIID